MHYSVQALQVLTHSTAVVMPSGTTGHLLAVLGPSNNLKQPASFSGCRQPVLSHEVGDAPHVRLVRGQQRRPASHRIASSAHTLGAQQHASQPAAPLAGGSKTQLARSGTAGACAAYLTAGLKPGSISDSAALAAAIGSHFTASAHASLRRPSGVTAPSARTGLRLTQAFTYRLAHMHTCTPRRPAQCPLWQANVCTAAHLRWRRGSTQKQHLCALSKA